MPCSVHFWTLKYQKGQKLEPLPQPSEPFPNHLHRRGNIHFFLVKSDFGKVRKTPCLDLDKNNKNPPVRREDEALTITITFKSLRGLIVFLRQAQEPGHTPQSQSDSSPSLGEQLLLFLVKRSVTGFLLSLISKHEMVRMGLRMADGSLLTVRQHRLQTQIL